MKFSEQKEMQKLAYNKFLEGEEAESLEKIFANMNMLSFDSRKIIHNTKLIIVDDHFEEIIQQLKSGGEVLQGKLSSLNENITQDLFKIAKDKYLLKLNREILKLVKKEMQDDEIYSQLSSPLIGQNELEERIKKIKGSAKFERKADRKKRYKEYNRLIVVSLGMICFHGLRMSQVMKTDTSPAIHLIAIVLSVVIFFYVLVKLNTT